MACGTAEERTLISNRKETTIKGCKERHREPEEEKAELACTLKPNCDDYLTCRRELGTAQLKKEAELALKTGENFERVFDTCKGSDVRDDAAKKLCVEIFKQAIATATCELAPLRDSGDLTGASKCVDLQTLAERVSPEEKAAADLVCKEVEAGAPRRPTTSSPAISRSASRRSPSSATWPSRTSRSSSPNGPRPA